jgi:hypothetical protein
MKKLFIRRKSVASTPSEEIVQVVALPVVDRKSELAKAAAYDRFFAAVNAQRARGEIRGHAG